MSIPKKMLETLIGPLDEKRRYRENQARVKRLPDDYRTTVEALSRYLMVAAGGGISKGEVLVTMLEELTDLFEQAASDGTPIRTVVGADPVDFAEEFARNYSDGQWINKERTRLITAIDAATGGGDQHSTTDQLHDGGVE